MRQYGEDSSFTGAFSESEMAISVLGRQRTDSKVVSMRMTAVCVVLRMVAIGDNTIGRQVILPE